MSEHSAAPAAAPSMSPALAPWVLPVAAVAAAFAMLSLGRLALLVGHPATFAALGAGELARAFTRGLVFDASIILASVGVPAFVLAVSEWAGMPRWWRLAWGWIAFGLFVALTSVEVADVVYFGEVQHHLGAEVLAVGNDLDFVVAAALRQHLAAVTLSLAGLAACAWGWTRLLARPVRPWRRWPAVAVAALVAIAIMVVVIRGGVTRKPIATINAMEGIPAAGGYLILDGPFVLAHTLTGAR
ncbi:MAG: hypothetical protein H0W83_10790, partial [Planctomycetes bacterium]|nr:hypothetical protein [Planctomycetota bacterium]